MTIVDCQPWNRDGTREWPFPRARVEFASKEGAKGVEVVVSMCYEPIVE